MFLDVLTLTVLLLFFTGEQADKPKPSEQRSDLAAAGGRHQLAEEQSAGSRLCQPQEHLTEHSPGEAQLRLGPSSSRQ